MVSLFKNNPVHRISETFNVQFDGRSSISPTMQTSIRPPPGNRQIFLVTGAVNANAGLLNATSTTSRQMQFALKFHGE